MKIIFPKGSRQIINNILEVKRQINKTDRLFVILVFILILSTIVCVIAYIESSFKLAFSGLTAVGTIGVAILSICMVFRNEKKDLVSKANEGYWKVYNLIRLMDKIICKYKEDLSQIDIYGYEIMYSNEYKTIDYREKERVYDYIEEVLMFLKNNFKNRLSINLSDASENDGLNLTNIRHFRNTSEGLQTVGLIYTGINEEVIEDTIYNQYLIKEYYIRLLSITQNNLENTLNELNTICEKTNT